MGRQIKTVSIPERLQARVDAIENFSGFVTAAIENQDQGIASLRIAALHRQITALNETVYEILEGISVDLSNIVRSGNPRHGAAMLKKSVDELRDDFRAVE